MSEAPNIQTVWDIEAQAESGIKAYFAANGIALLTTRDKSTAQDTYVACMVQLGPATGQYDQLPDGSHEFNEFEATILVRIGTFRPEEGDSAVSGIDKRHSQLRAKARWLMSNSKKGLTLSYLPYHDISQLVPAESDYEAGAGYDITTLAWSARIYIRPDAWPSS